jgi:hypothetical protein
VGWIPGTSDPTVATLLMQFCSSSSRRHQKRACGCNTQICIPLGRRQFEIWHTDLPPRYFQPPRKWDKGLSGCDRCSAGSVTVIISTRVGWGFQHIRCGAHPPFSVASSTALPAVGSSAHARVSAKKTFGKIFGVPRSTAAVASIRLVSR